MKTKFKKLTAFLGLALCMLLSLRVNANAKTLDEILDYEILGEVNEDGSVKLHYHIEWKVLDSSSEGPLEWVEVGIPNKHAESVVATSGCDIKSIKIQSGSYPSVRIDLNRSFYQDEVAVMDFVLVQNNLYQMNKFQDGYTVYDFTPGYFDNIEVDKLVIYWNYANVDSFTPSADIKGDLLVWTSSLGMGEKYSITVTYPNEAYGFTELHSNDGSDGYGGDDGSSGGVFEAIFSIIGGLLAIVVSVGPVVLVIWVVRKVIDNYSSGANLGSGTKKKVTRTLITYYPTCQGCGATREENQTFCTYCGRSFVEKEETVTEENVAPENKDVLKYNTAGTYKYSSRPNTFVRVNVVNVPVPRSTYSSSSSSRSSSSHSSCAHSSCAHSSCACACACACAGGGRAGCTFKDFYNTNLKLRYLEYKKSK